MIDRKTLPAPYCPAKNPKPWARCRGIYLLYFISASLIIAIKYWYARADSSDLEWILLPTARWAEFLSGIPFERAPQIGYVNHSLRFIIAPSCSGVQFMIIAFAALCFPFLHKTESVKKGFCLIPSALAAAFLYTVAANGFRIVLSICLPPLLMDILRKTPCGNYFSAERLHTLIGTAVYFTALLLLYRGAEILFRIARRKADTPKDSGRLLPGCTAGMRQTGLFLRYLPPVLCYFSVTLGIPFLCRIYRNNWTHFPDYAALVTAICLTVLLCFGLSDTIRRRMGSRFREGRNQAPHRYIYQETDTHEN